MRQRAEVAQRDEPAKVHRQRVFLQLAVRQCPAVEQPQEQCKNWRHKQHTANQPVGEATMHCKRCPRRPAKEYIDIGHVGREHARRQAFARAVLQACFGQRPTHEAVCQVVQTLPPIDWARFIG